MDLGSILVILAVLLLVGLYIGQPILEGKTKARYQPATPQDHELSSLLAERDRLINAIQELDFDYALGKIPADEYPIQRAAWMQRGAEVLRKLDELQGKGAEQNQDDRIEAIIAARRAAAPAAAAAAAGSGYAPAQRPDDELEALLANRRRERQEKAGGFCPRCGKAVQKSDRFCPKCGTALS